MKKGLFVTAGKVDMEGDKELKDLILFSNPKQKIQLKRVVNRVLERLKN